uniref:Uncharacterized protein n=1 Tax=Cyanoderma ruficeps TaxID=181631 RepID=A0A8C3QQJ9_9PASS
LGLSRPFSASPAPSQSHSTDPCSGHLSLPCLTRPISVSPDRPLLGLSRFLPHPPPLSVTRPQNSVPSWARAVPVPCLGTAEVPRVPCPVPSLTTKEKLRGWRVAEGAAGGLVSKALLQSLGEERGCCLLYVVEDRPEEVERAFGAEVPAGQGVPYKPCLPLWETL